MIERRLTNLVYKASVSGQVGIDLIEDVPKKDQVNQQAWVKALMSAAEAKAVCQIRSKWKSVVAAYPIGKDVKYVYVPILKTFVLMVVLLFLRSRVQFPVGSVICTVDN